MRRAFREGIPLAEIAKPRQGLATGNNDRFLREWWEVAGNQLGLGLKNRHEAKQSGLKWFPCSKGGGFRKWYGNNDVVINWENDGLELESFPGSVIRNPEYYFKEGMTWGTISSSKLSMRSSAAGSISEHAGSSIYIDHDTKSYLAILAFSNCSVAEAILAILSPSLRFTEGPVGLLPVLAIEKCNGLAVETAINLARNDYDSFETSWDFKRHPLV